MKRNMIGVLRLILLLVIMHVGDTIVSGQDVAFIDSLKVRYESNDNDSIGVDLLIRIYDEYYLYAIDSARVYIDKAAAQNDKLKNPYLSAQLNLRSSKLSVSEGDLDKALELLKIPQKYFESHRTSNELYGLYYNYAAIYYSKSEYDQALEYNQLCIDVLNEFPAGNSDEWKDDLAKTYHFRAAILINNGFTDQAKSYLEQGLEVVVSPNIKGVLLQVLAYLNIAEDDYDSAKITLEKSIALCRVSKDPHACYSTHMEMGKLYRHIEELDSATVHYVIAKKYAEENGTVHYLMNVYQGMSNLEVAKGNYVHASELFGKTNELYEQYPEVLVQADFYKYWAEVENEIGNYQHASNLFIKHHELNDSTLNEENRAIVADLETKYDISEKENDLIKSQLDSERAFGQRNLFIGLGVLALIAGLYFWNRNRVNKTLAKQQADLKNQQIEHLEKEKKILSMNAMIEGQEAERIRIAKDLHDGLGGLLSTVKAHFSNIQSEIQKVEKLNVFNRANEMMDEACDEVRRISHNLMPGALRLEGLKSAVEHLGEETASAHAFKVEVEAVNFNTRMEESREVFVYRIIQEALNNIVKHAAAKQVLIQLSETDPEYHIIIEDDGKGFDPLQIASGLGLKSIQSRVDFLKGNLDIDTKEGVGTTITIHIPKEGGLT